MLDTILSPLEYIVSAVLLGVHSVLGPIFGQDSGWSWGISIVVLVLIIRTALIPLFVKQIRAQRGMQLLQPRMVEIRKKYKTDRQRQSEEMMKLYKETGTNPLSSCLPLLAQSPFFFGLYRVLEGIARDHPRGLIGPDQIASAKDARIFGAPLSQSFLTATSSSTKAVIVVMIVSMVATQFLTQRQIMLKNMPGGADNPLAQQQKIMLYIFPLVFAVSGVYFPVGVLLYWLTTNVWTGAQQFYVIRKMPAPGSHAERALHERRASKGKAGDGSALATEPPKPRVIRQQPKKQPRAARARPGAPATPSETPPPTDAAQTPTPSPSAEPEAAEPKSGQNSDPQKPVQRKSNDSKSAQRKSAPPKKAPTGDPSAGSDG